MARSLGFWRVGLFFASSPWSHGLRVSSTFDHISGLLPEAMFVHTDIVILTKFVTALIEHAGYLKA